MTSVKIRVNGVRIDFRCDDASLRHSVVARFGGGVPPFGEELPDDRDVGVRVNAGVATLEHLGLVGRVQLDRAEITAPPASLVFADVLVRAALAWRLAERGAILLHASAVKAKGGAVVAFGVSGAGKSTVARTLGGALSDELVQIGRAPGGGWEVAGTPWWHGSGERAPLSRLVWLVRGEPPTTRMVRGAELLRALAREAGRYFPDPTFQRRVFEVCAELADLGAVRVAAAEGRVADDVARALG